MDTGYTPLQEALAACSGIVCAIGAGGKKTTLQALFTQATGRVGLTCTTLTPPFPPVSGAARYLEAPDQLERLLAAGDHPRVCYGLPSDKPNRVGPLPVEAIPRLHALGNFGLTLVKADGARMRWIKAPGTHEPQVVPGSTVLAITSIQAVGRPLGAGVAHRPERISAVTGLPLEAPITIGTIARLYTRAGGLNSRTGGGRVIPVLSMVDDGEALALARDCAAGILDSGLHDRVVLLSHRVTGLLREVIPASAG